MMQVETIGDGYMVAGGVPVPTKFHAQEVVEMAFAMLTIMEKLPNPVSENKEHLKIRIGKFQCLQT